MDIRKYLVIREVLVFYKIYSSYFPSVRTPCCSGTQLPHPKPVPAVSVSSWPLKTDDEKLKIYVIHSLKSDDLKPKKHCKRGNEKVEKHASSLQMLKLRIKITDGFQMSYINLCSYQDCMRTPTLIISLFSFYR